MKAIHKLLFLFFITYSLVCNSQNSKSYNMSIDTLQIPDGFDPGLISTIIIEDYESSDIINSEYDISGICINMEHEYIGDLVIALECPNGQSVTLHQQSGGTTNLGEPVGTGPGIGYTYCWTNEPEYGTFQYESETTMTLPSGSYTTIEPLSDFIGCPMNGPWTIHIYDLWSDDNGYFFGWSLDLLSSANCFSEITGRVYKDLNNNNVYDTGDIPHINQAIIASPGPYYGITNTEGLYTINLPEGNFLIEQNELSDSWQQSHPLSPTYYNISIPDQEEHIYENKDFVNTVNTFCPDLEIDISSSEIGICDYSIFMVTYFNNGSELAQNAYVELKKDENFTFISSPNFVSQDGNILIFEIGDIEIGESGQFYIQMQYSCNPDLAGATSCNTATIYPNNLCIEPNIDWDNSSISVSGECIEDEACFTITNIAEFGVGDMETSSEYRIYRNNINVETGSFQLNGEQYINICWPADGSTIRLEADQNQGHPGSNNPNSTVELCGSSNQSFGYVLDFPQNDNDNYIETECLEVFAPMDPNDKSVTPSGIGEQNYIADNTILEYKIRFQNIGTAPAENIYIYDTISHFLDLNSFNQLNSSHYCFYEILFPNIIKWTFPNIMLPDSTSNEPESHGFIKYKIQQAPNNTIGTIIENSAAIFFDYNFPIITNKTFNTIGDIIEITTSDFSIYNNSKDVQVFPNPSSSTITFDVYCSNYLVEIYNIYGMKLSYIKSNTNYQTTVDIKNFSNGIYFYKILVNNETTSTGKFLKI